ncbi:hypothetical protein [Achromobacter anxifer]
MKQETERPQAGCCRVFSYRVHEGKSDEYRQYLRDIVEVIDLRAQEAGAFLDVVLLARLDPASGCEQHHRGFTFRDAAHRAAFADRIAQEAARYDVTEEARAGRKAYAETLRVLESVEDYFIHW